MVEHSWFVPQFVQNMYASLHCYDPVCHRARFGRGEGGAALRVLPAVDAAFARVMIAQRREPCALDVPVLSAFTRPPQRKDIVMPVFTSIKQIFTSPHLHPKRVQDGDEVGAVQSPSTARGLSIHAAGVQAALSWRMLGFSPGALRGCLLAAVELV